MSLDLASIYTQHRRALIAHALQHGCDAASADDLVQDLFLTLHKGASSSLDVGQNIYAYLTQGVRWMLSKRRRANTSSRRGGGAVHEPLDLAQELHSADDSPSESMTRRELAAALAKCGVTEDAALITSGMDATQRMRVYRFRKKAAPQVAKLLAL